jgi:hypothetical protein
LTVGAVAGNAGRTSEDDSNRWTLCTPAFDVPSAQEDVWHDNAVVSRDAGFVA